MTGQVRRSMHSRPGAATRRAGPTVRPPQGPAGPTLSLTRAVSRALLPRHIPSWVQLPDVLPHSRAIRSYFFQKTPLRPALGQKEKGPKALFLRLSKKRLCHFFEKAAACRARDWSAASGQTPHLQPEKCFPRRTCRRGKQIKTGFAPAGANSARLFSQAGKRRTARRSAVFPYNGDATGPGAPRRQQHWPPPRSGSPPPGPWGCTR